jgi:diguanylate cyclase (GGDEF)-like protein
LLEGNLDVRASFRAVFGGLFRSLASRVGFFVFAATLISALAVATTSAFAVREFLRSKLEARIPEAATGASERLELWFAQRALEVEIFSHAAIVTNGLARLASGPGRARSVDRSDVEQYLRYVREGLPSYAAIFALAPDGRELASVGAHDLLDPALARRLAGVQEVQISDLLTTASGARVQIISAPVKDADARPAATLHAILPYAQLHKQLVATAQENGGRLVVFDAGGALVASSLDGELAPARMPAPLAPSARGEVVGYAASDGTRVVASAMPLPRLGWRIVFEGDYGSTFAPIASILQRTVGLNLGIVLVLAGLAFAAARSLLEPLHELSSCAERLRDGESGVVLPVVTSHDEVGILTRSFGEMVDSLTRANEALAQLAITDGLTKIHNHRFFQDRLPEAIRRSESTGEPLALILVDIDDFKALNDRHGHAGGDAVLEQLAAVLAAQARDRDLVARYGGEEFVVLAPDADLADAIALAEKLRLAVHACELRPAPQAEPLAVTISVGVACYQGDAARLFADADRALYAAKHAGKDCVMAAGA